jgi:hypothetical protein
MPGPVHQRSASDISRANHQIAITRGRHEARQVVDVVRAVSVHLTDEIGTLLERVPHAVDVGAPEPLLARPMDHLHTANVLMTQS